MRSDEITGGPVLERSRLAAACGHARGRPRDEQREQAILDAAVELLGEVGYDRMSMESVAHRARASKATIYRRWPGKAELVVEAVRRRTCADLAPVDTGSLRGDLLAFLAAAGLPIAEDATLLSGVILAMRSDPTLATLLREQMSGDKAAAAVALVTRAIQRGELPATADARLVPEIAPAVVFFRLLVTGEPVDQTFLVHLVDDVLIPLLGRPSSTPTRRHSPQSRKDNA